MKTEDQLRVRLHNLRIQIHTMEQYRDVCIQRHDRHGVMDAEADMRELEARVDALLWVIGDDS